MINKRRSRRRYNEEAVELNITAFLNLMVILIPFLLITAVFSKLAILELNLPGTNANENISQANGLNLELVIRKGSFDVQEASSGFVRRFERNQGDEDWQEFSNLLVEIKALYPAEESITLLLEPGIPYKTLIKVMDRVTSTKVQIEGEQQFVSLFPTISISDAAAFISEAIEQQGNTLEQDGAIQ